MFRIEDITLLMPEIVLSVMIMIVLLVDVFLSVRYKFITYYLSNLTLLTTSAVTCYLWSDTGIARIILSNSFIISNFEISLKIAICLGTILIFSYSKRYVLTGRSLSGEYYILTMLSVLGMLVLVSAYNFLNLYLGLELLALPLYALIVMSKNDSKAIEAGVKYFMMGSVASGILLYGISLVYGATGSFAISHSITDSSVVHAELLPFAIIFILSGVIFKLGAAPMHIWLPDVYQGSVTAITLFISSIPKLAAFALAIKVIAITAIGLQVDLYYLLMFIAITSMVLGNICALVQTNLKRLLAYAAIGHVGFILLGFICGDSNGLVAALFYLICYLLATVGLFAVLIILKRNNNDIVDIASLNGLGSRSPWSAFGILLLVLSMAGIPPLVGFYSKLLIIKALLQHGVLSIAVISILLSVVGMFYYLKIIKTMYFTSDNATFSLHGGSFISSYIIFPLNALIVLILGIYPEVIIVVCQNILNI